MADLDAGQRAQAASMAVVAAAEWRIGDIGAQEKLLQVELAH